MRPDCHIVWLYIDLYCLPTVLNLHDLGLCFLAKTTEFIWSLNGAHWDTNQHLDTLNHWMIQGRGVIQAWFQDLPLVKVVGVFINMEMGWKSSGNHSIALKSWFKLKTNLRCLIWFNSDALVISNDKTNHHLSWFLQLMKWIQQ